MSLTDRTYINYTEGLNAEKSIISKTLEKDTAMPAWSFSLTLTFGADQLPHTQSTLFIFRL